MNVPLVDLVAQYHAIREEIDAAIQGVLEAGSFIMGPNVLAFEGEIAEYLGASHAVGLASGTDALTLALRALSIGPGDEVIAPAFTFYATVEAIQHVGARPVLVDVRPDTYALDVAAVAARITPRTRAVIPVHLYGHPANMGALMDLAGRAGIDVVEDCAQAIGASVAMPAAAPDGDGESAGGPEAGGDTPWRPAGGIGRVTCLSFFPSKNLGAYGDAGMLVTSDEAVAERVRMLRTHGWRRKYHPEMVGYNSRLDELQAAILRVKLGHLEAWTEARRRLAARYTEALAAQDVRVPTEAPWARHVYHLYVVRVPDRAAVQEKLRAAGVASAVYYPLPVHLLDPCRDLGYVRGSFPVAEQASRETLAIPLYPEMTDAQHAHVIATLAAALRAVADQPAVRAQR